MGRKEILPELGTLFGNWEYLGRAPSRGEVKYAKVRCVCGSGTEKEVQKSALIKGRTQSCGCLQVLATKEANITHGKRDDRIYNIWRGMLKRCELVTSKDFRRYGGKGITVDETWKNFECFYADMGDPPFKGASLERKRNSEGYYKENCIWATAHMQSRNKSNNVWATIGTVKMVLRDWLNLLGHNEATILARRKEGMSVDEALLKGSPSCPNPASVISSWVRNNE